MIILYEVPKLPSSNPNSKEKDLEDKDPKPPISDSEKKGDAKDTDFPTDEDATTDEDNIDSENEDSDEDATTDGTTETQDEPPVNKVKLQTLFDDILSLRGTCEFLIRGIETAISASSNDKLGKILENAHSILDNAIKHCNIVLVNFSSYSYDNCLAISRTVGERVEAVAKMLKHVIDGDDDTRTPGPNKS
jgi:hypothetical protein